MVTSEMPANGPLRLGSVGLPAGMRLSGWDDGGPLLWATSEPVPDAGRVWQALSDMRPDTGLVPILLAFLDGGYRGRPWDEGELNDRCGLVDVDGLDVATVLAESWANSLPDPEELEEDEEAAAMIAPFGARFPGLAAAQDQALPGAELERALGWFAPARIGLVPASRPADVLALVGYNGTVNRYGSPGQLSAALRSWEDRFGAELVEVGFDHIRLLARRPPTTVSAAQAAAAELWSFCDEFWPVNLGEGVTSATSKVSTIASHITESPIWSLWLD